jgi:hypothetical protein
MYRANPSDWISTDRNLANPYVNRYLGSFTRRFRWLQRPELVIGAGCLLLLALAYAAMSCVAMVVAIPLAQLGR